ncbi:hypothetical protein [Ferrimonas balearica]|uniref:hypothetical protein n=1 Tax=Ferrimonas balearica TaxID=44012 RepID=UPI001C9A27AE|nr:hypothetical protein [Ferrimonas balearica]MBY5991791.1 hypothetical protein [Ferrimonas balearica]
MRPYLILAALTAALSSPALAGEAEPFSPDCDKFTWEQRERNPHCTNPEPDNPIEVDPSNPIELARWHYEVEGQLGIPAEVVHRLCGEKSTTHPQDNRVVSCYWRESKGTLETRAFDYSGAYEASITSYIEGIGSERTVVTVTVREKGGADDLVESFATTVSLEGEHSESLFTTERYSVESEINNGKDFRVTQWLSRDLDRETYRTIANFQDAVMTKSEWRYDGQMDSVSVYNGHFTFYKTVNEFLNFTHGH